MIKKYSSFDGGAHNGNCDGIIFVFLLFTFTVETADPFGELNESLAFNNKSDDLMIQQKN